MALVHLKACESVFCTFIVRVDRQRALITFFSLRLFTIGAGAIGLLVELVGSTFARL